MKQHRNPRSNALSKVSFDLSSIPAQLQQPDELDVWVTNGWVKVSNQEIGLVGKGLEVVGKKRLQTLQRKIEQTDVKPNEKAQIEAKSQALPTSSSYGLEALRQKDTETLRRYVEGNGHLLKGHPKREDHNGTHNLPEAVGTYQESAVILEKELVESVVGGPLPKGLRIKETQGETGSSLEIPLCHLQQLEPLKAWVQENRHRLKGHTAHKFLATTGETPQVVGLFQPEVVALPKKVFKNLLGSVPTYGQETRPTIDGKRRYLVSVELTPREA